MTRGFGVRQQLILDVLKLHGPYYLDALAGGDMDRYRRLYAAAVKLVAGDHVQFIKHTTGSPSLIVATLGVKAEQLDRDEIEANSQRVPQWLKLKGEI